MLKLGRRSNLFRLLVALVASAAIVAAFGSSGRSASTSEAAVPTTKLSGVCPKTLTLQIDWFPEAEYGRLLLADRPEGQAERHEEGHLQGPLGKTGINLEIRAGGPFIGQQTVQSLMFQDDRSTSASCTPTTPCASASGSRPCRWSHRSSTARSHCCGIPRSTTSRRSGTSARSGANILVFTKAVNYVPFLIKKGIVPESSFDDSFDGSYSGSSPTRRSCSRRSSPRRRTA